VFYLPGKTLPLSRGRCSFLVGFFQAALGFRNELGFRFDPVCRGVARPPLGLASFGDEIVAKLDVFKRDNR
ncbi:MAG: hypothetical protein ACKOF3_01695, partial [Spartobacteria bacterium]